MKHILSQLTLKNKVAFLLLSLILLGCNFRIELYNNNNKEVSQRIFDNSPPNVYIIYPNDGSILSNIVSIIGQTEDNSPTITYIVVGNQTFHFTNQRNWVLEINTLELTNGKFEIEIFAKDSLNNTSQKKKFTFYISNSISLHITPQGFLITNANFEFNLTLNTTNYTKLKVYLNNSLILETNGIKDIRLPISTNQEYLTNTLLCIVDHLTNTRYFLFDYTPPTIAVLIPSNSYIYGNYPFSVWLDDFDRSLLFLSNSSSLNMFTLNKGTNHILVNTYYFTNGTNNITFWAVDSAGNTSPKIEITTIVANFFSTEYNRIKNKNYYQLDIEEHIGDTLIFYTDSDFRNIFRAKESDNFNPNKTTSSSIQISPSGKIRSISTGNKVLLAYRRDNESLIIRTNKDSTLTNFPQMSNHGAILDFEIFENGKLYVVKTTTNGSLLVTDISNKLTNFITNLSRDVYVFAEKHQLHSNYVFGVYCDQYVMIFTNSGIFFHTNQNTIGGSIVSLDQNELHFCTYSSNVATIYIVYNNTILTNYTINTTNRIYHIVGDRYNNSSIWGLVEKIDHDELGLRLIQVDKNKILRNQLIDRVKYSEAYEGFREVVIWSTNGSIKIIIVSTEPEIGGYYAKIIKFTGL